jgi:Zn-dependent protease with chaperone function
MMTFGLHSQPAWLPRLALIFCLACFPLIACRAQSDAAERIRRVVEEVRQSSYPELQGIPLLIQLFTSDSDYFQARFTNASFLGRRQLRYVLFVNRRLLAQPPPDDALRAVLAHELGHVLYYRAHYRLRLLWLLRLCQPSFAARFERATDLVALERGYGRGLKAYREWLYQRIPAGKLAEKQRNYFSPAEIDALLRRMQAQPALLQQWRKSPPRSLAEIEQ